MHSEAALSFVKLEVIIEVTYAYFSAHFGEQRDVSLPNINRRRKILQFMRLERYLNSCTQKTFALTYNALVNSNCVAYIILSCKV